MELFIARIVRSLVEATGLTPEAVKIEKPRDAKFADLAFPCFLLAKSLRKAPPAIAAELAASLESSIEEVSVTATGPYLNFRIERGALARQILHEVESQGARYGGGDEGNGKTIVIDFSSPNIAKPMHVGHLRSTILGAALGRIFTHLGYRTVGINHIGDWGSQFGGLVVAIRRWRDEVDLEQDPTRGLLELYQRSRAAAKEDEGFLQEARVAWRELEAGGEGEVRELWRWVTEVSLAAFERTYARLGIHHDLVRGESFYEPLLEDTVTRAKEAGITEVSDGALVVRLESVDKGLENTPCLLRQKDGTTLYATRDLAGLYHRWEEFQFERALYVVGAEQKLHFRQLKALLTRLGVAWNDRVEHIDFGLLLGPGRVKLASRQGTVLVLDELIDEVVDEALRIVTEKNPELTNKEEVAEMIGVGAIVFNDLKRERIRDVVFDKADILSFEGETGAYVQYAHARMASILRKAEERGEGQVPVDPALLEDAGAVLLRLGHYPSVLRSAAKHAEPSEVANALIALARELSSWLSHSRVLGEDPPVTAARLSLVRAAKGVLSSGLALLGVQAPEEM